MGDQQLSEFRDDIKLRLGNREDATTSDTQLERWINRAYRHLCLPQVFRHREMQQLVRLTLATNTINYALTSTTEPTSGLGISAVRSVFHTEENITTTPTTQRRTLHYRSIKSADMRTRSTLSAAPSEYSLEGTNITIGPGIPDSTIAGQFIYVRVWAIPAVLSNDTDVTVLEPYWDEIVVEGAAWRALKAVGRNEEAEIAKQDYVALINERRDFETAVVEEDWGHTNEPGILHTDQRVM